MSNDKLPEKLLFLQQPVIGFCNVAFEQTPLFQPLMPELFNFRITGQVKAFYFALGFNRPSFLVFKRLIQRSDGGCRCGAHQLFSSDSYCPWLVTISGASIVSRAKDALILFCCV